MNMALEAVVFPQGPFGCAMNTELPGFGDGTTTGGWSFLYDGFGGDQETTIEVDGVVSYGEWDAGLPLPSVATAQNRGGEEEEEEVEEKKAAATTTEAVVVGRKKRRRTKSCKNKEEVENQRMTHIAVERNRRKLMNDYLAVLRSFMPPSYVQRGDQASIVGGAINFVKELEQLLQSLEAQRRLKLAPNPSGISSSSAAPFSDFFTFPQYSTSAQCGNAASPSTNTASETIAKSHSAVADIEVTMVESHANLKVLSKQRPKQLLKMVLVLQSLRLTTLHLNVTTVDQMVLYSFSLKVEDDCHLTTVDDIATAVYHMVGKIQEEAGVI